MGLLDDDESRWSAWPGLLGTGQAGPINQPQRAPFGFAPPVAEMKAATYTPTQLIGNAVADGLMALGMKPYTANDLTSRVGNVIAASPVGLVGAAANTIDAQMRGDNMGVIQGMAGMLPGVGPEARAAALEARNVARVYRPGEGGAGRLGPEAAGTEAGIPSKQGFIYNPPPKPLRPFEADYPKGVSGEPGSPLVVDNRGTALTAENIVGRRTVGGADEALSPERLDAAATSVLGRRPEGVAGREIRGNAGVFRTGYNAEGNREYRIFVDQALSPAARDKVIAHEFGHAIDYFSNTIPTEGLTTELRQLYNTLNTGTERTRHLTGPDALGYRGEEIGREYMAEAIRAYMADPNYIKTVAPKTAARIRDYVNSNPRLNTIIQFNGLAPFALVPPALLSNSGGSEDR